VIVGGLEVTDESLSDYVIHTSPATFEFAPDPALPARFGQALCVIARRSDHAPLRSLLPQLNKLITILQSPG
jgi:hypothetical protein